MHVEYPRYIETPVTPYRRAIFNRLIRNISGGSVCDLGSHAVGHYWALGYAERVREIAFLDISEEAVALQQKTLDILSPAMLEERYGDTLAFLKAEHIASGDPVHAALALQENVDRIERFDFLKDVPEKAFDWLIAIESLEIVKSQNEYAQAFQTARQLLKPGTGRLLAVVVPYSARDNNVECLCQSGLEGTLNPGEEETRAALSEAGFKDFSVETVETQMENYPLACFITACR